MIGYLLTTHRDKQAALRFFRKAIRQHGLPDKVSIDKSGANTAAIEALQEETGYKIEIRQNTYLNHLIEQDHRAIKRIIRPMLGFKSFRSARIKHLPVSLSVLTYCVADPESLWLTISCENMSVIFNPTISPRTVPLAVDIALKDETAFPLRHALSKVTLLLFGFFWSLAPVSDHRLVGTFHFLAQETDPWCSTIALPAK